MVRVSLSLMRLETRLGIGTTKPSIHTDNGSPPFPRIPGSTVAWIWSTRSPTVMAGLPRKRGKNHEVEQGAAAAKTHYYLLSVSKANQILVSP